MSIKLIFGVCYQKVGRILQESIDTMTSCSLPSGLATDRLTSSNKVEVGSTDVMPSF